MNLPPQEKANIIGLMNDRTSDTQWPRFMVFQQDEPGGVFRYNGTVHAPDAEMALLNGKDVFVRRPSVSALWVVPAESILSLTNEEIEADAWGRGVKASDAAPQSFHVFGKLDHQGQAVQLGEVAAPTHELAMKSALTEFADRRPHRWWVFPEQAVSRSQPEDAPSLFDPAKDKSFREQYEYHTVTMMRQINSKGKLDDEAG